jgi:hypothetical protein
VTLIVVLKGIELAIRKFRSTSSDEDGKEENGKLSVTGDSNTILQIGGHLISITPEQLSDAVDTSIRSAGKDRVAKAALEFIRPAKREAGSIISGGGAVISAQTIAEAPSELDMEMQDDEEPSESIQKQVVVIHATDIDHSKSGWAGHLPGRWNHRLRMQIYPGIDNKSIFGKTQVVADIILVSKPDRKGQMTPYLFHVLRVYD